MSFEFERKKDDYNSILVKSLGDRIAEALAEMMHKKVRTDLWGYSKDEDLTNEQLIREDYKGIRPAPVIQLVLITLKKKLFLNFWT